MSMLHLISRVTGAQVMCRREPCHFESGSACKYKVRLFFSLSRAIRTGSFTSPFRLTAVCTQGVLMLGPVGRTAGEPLELTRDRSLGRYDPQ